MLGTQETRNLLKEHGPLAILLLLLLVMKSPDALSNAQLWAEDGVIFLSQQYGHALPQVNVPYAGYLHLIPRLIAWLATAFPLKNTPSIYNTAAIFIDAASILYFAIRMRLLVGAVTIFAIFALTPTNGEIFGTLTNIQWFTQFALFAMAFTPSIASTNRKQSIWACIGAAILSLTGPFSIFIALIAGAALLLKLAGVTFRTMQIKAIDKWFAESNKKILAIIIACSIIQLSILVLSGNRASKGPFDLTLAKNLFFHGLQLHTFGQVILTNALLIVLLSALVYLALNSARKNDDASVVLMAAMAFFSIGQIVAVAHVNADALSMYVSFNGDRYFTFAKISFWIIVAYILRHRQPNADRNHEWAVFLLLIFVAINHTDQLRRPNLPDLNWKGNAATFEKSPSNYPRTIPINPTPWEITIYPHQDAH